MAFEQLHREIAEYVPPIFSIQGRRPDFSRVPIPPAGLPAFEAERIRHAPFILAEYGFGNQAITIVDKVAPHSVTDFMLSITGKTAPALFRDLHPSVARGMLRSLGAFAKYATEPETIEKFGLQDGFFRITVNCDEATNDRESVQTDKNFHPHCICFPAPSNEWKLLEVRYNDASDINRLKIIDPSAIIGPYLIQDLIFNPQSPYYREEISDVFEPVPFDPAELFSKEMPLGYHLKMRDSWNTFNNPTLPKALQVLNNQTDAAYSYIAGLFVPQDEISTHPTPWTRPSLYTQEQIIANIQAANHISDVSKNRLTLLASNLQIIPSNVMNWLRTKKQHLKVGMAERLLTAQGPSYTWTFYSPGRINDIREGKKWKRDAYLVIQPTLTRTLGAGGVSFGPNGEILKVERGERSVFMDNAELVKRADFQIGFADFLSHIDLGLNLRRTRPYERKFPEEKTYPPANHDVINKGIAAALNHFNGSSNPSTPGFNFKPLPVDTAQMYGLAHSDLSKDNIQYALGNTTVDEKKIAFRAEFRDDGGIFRLYDFIILDGEIPHRLNSSEEFAELFGIDPSELLNIKQCIQNERKYDKRYSNLGQEFRNIFRLNKKYTPDEMPFSIHEAVQEIQAQLGSGWKSQVIGLFESFNDGGRPGNVHVPYAFLSGIPLDYFPTPGGTIDIPLVTFPNGSSPSYFDRLENYVGSTLKTSDGFAFALHPFTMNALGLSASDFPHSQFSTIQASPTASIRSLQVANSNSSLPIGEHGTTIKVSLKARLSNDVKMLTREDLEEMMATSRIFQTSKRPLPTTFLPQPVHEVVGIETTKGFLGCCLRDLPEGLGTNEIPVSGFAITADLPREFGGTPLVIQAVEKYLERTDFEGQSSAILNWFRNTIAVPPIDAMNYCVSQNVLPLMHAQDVAWAYDTQTGELQPKVIIKDLQDVLSTQPEKRTTQLVRMFDYRFCEYLIQPIIDILTSTYGIDSEHFYQVIREEFDKRMENKREFLIHDEALTIIVDMFVIAFEGKGKSRNSPNQNLFSKPPRFRYTDVSKYQ